ncbi:hypothetical protein DPMN_007874 [Dreissena polymorpha]|uniref:Uncharacterized protein n=1 Tax=Dreissena polymorpha TaxID=45954 RepID=A0A9D4RWE6_DREPO|nr:hypothetical protein DPMN_007874 [Dreissena polymorpha]
MTSTRSKDLTRLMGLLQKTRGAKGRIVDFYTKNDTASMTSTRAPCGPRGENWRCYNRNIQRFSHRWPVNWRTWRVLMNVGHSDGDRVASFY